MSAVHTAFISLTKISNELKDFLPKRYRSHAQNTMENEPELHSLASLHTVALEKAQCAGGGLNAQARNEKSRCLCSGFFGLDHPLKDGAQEKTRTSTPLRELAPEASASTNSATWAGEERG